MALFSKIEEGAFFLSRDNMVELFQTFKLCHTDPETSSGVSASDRSRNKFGMTLNEHALLRCDYFSNIFDWREFVRAGGFSAVVLR